jgi:Flp pilus assembly protein TadD
MIEKLPPLPTAENLRKAEQQKMSLARLSEEKGNLADARHIYEELLKKNPNHYEAHRRMGVVATRESKFAEADQHFHKAWQIGPQTAGLATDMGYRLYLEHRLPEAEQMLRKAVEMEPNHPAANNNLGLVLGQMNRIDEAMACFRKVNSEADAHANLAYVMTQIGRTEEAKQEFSIALSKDPNMRSAANGLLALTGNLRPMQRNSIPNPSGPQQNGPAVANNGPQPNQAQMPQPTQNLTPSSGWQSVPLVEQRVPVNPQAPSQTVAWNGPQPTVPNPPQGYGPPGGFGPQPGNNPPAGFVAGPPQSQNSNNAQPASYQGNQQSNQGQQAAYQGQPAPYGGVPAYYNRVPANAGPESYPMQFSNGISAQAGPPGTFSK